MAVGKLRILKRIYICVDEVDGRRCPDPSHEVASAVIGKLERELRDA